VPGLAFRITSLFVLVDDLIQQINAIRYLKQSLGSAGPCLCALLPLSCGGGVESISTTSYSAASSSTELQMCFVRSAYVSGVKWIRCFKLSFQDVLDR
jgi:hypothetical protein